MRVWTGAAGELLSELSGYQEQIQGERLVPAPRQQPSAAGRVLSQAAPDGALARHADPAGDASAIGSAQHSFVLAGTAARAGQAGHSSDASARGAVRSGS